VRDELAAVRAELREIKELLGARPDGDDTERDSEPVRAGGTRGT
jgi:hypothetical protein